MNRLGMTIPLPAELRAHPDLFKNIEDLGYTDVWSAEVDGADAFTPLALAAVATDSLRLGTAIVPVYTRGAALLAQSAATLASLAPGRFILGLGSSSKVIVEGWNAEEFSKPYERTRDTLYFVREAFAGERVTRDYETFSVRGFRLALVPDEKPPIYIAGLRPGMLRLGAHEADGVIVNWLSPADVKQVAAVTGSCDIVARIFVVATSDQAHARAIGRKMILNYLNVPAYMAQQKWLGRDALQPMWALMAERDRAAAAQAIPDSVVDDLIVHGSPEECRVRIEAYREFGVTTPLPAIIHHEGPLEETLSRIARQ